MIDWADEKALEIVMNVMFLRSCDEHRQKVVAEALRDVFLSCKRSVDDLYADEIIDKHQWKDIRKEMKERLCKHETPADKV